MHLLFLRISIFLSRYEALFQTVPIDAILHHGTAVCGSSSLQLLRGIAHSHTGAHSPKHLQIIVAISERHAIGFGDAIELQHL